MVGAFAECFNEVSKKQQKDIVITFWDNITNEVNTKYLTSAFLGRTFQDS